VTLRYQVSILASAIGGDLPIDITNAELSQLFGHSGSWAQRMMARYEQEVQTGHSLSRGRPRLVESEQEQVLIQLCLR
jgi:transposase